MTDTEDKIIKVFKKLTVTRAVEPSTRIVAKKVGCHHTMVFKTIKKWKAQNKVWGLKN